MYEDKVYWLWLQHAFGAGSEKPVSIVKRFNDVREFYEGGKSLWASMNFISDKEILTLSDFTPDKASAQIEYCEKLEQSVICYSDEDYPEKLRNIHASPAVLFVKGEMPDFDDELVISVVGSRKASADVIKSTEYICYELSKHGVIIVSGGALGIDAAAHRGAMKSLSETVCVLACSIEFPYLMENKFLRGRVVDRGGCLITEYPEETGVFKGTFQVRNRLMSGLSNGLFVVRAEEKSGTMITVSHAIRQNKDVFAMPGDITDPYSVGTNKLIRDGAVPVLCVDDILNHYSDLINKKKRVPKAPEQHSKTLKNYKLPLSKKAERVYELLGKEPVHVSVICEQTGMRVSEILAAITELELLDYVKTYSGQRCSLK